MQGYGLRRWIGAMVCGLALLGLGGAARAADVVVQPAPGAGFAVTDSTGASPRLKVLESGEVFLGGLVSVHPVQSKPVCYDPASGQVGDCAAAPGGPTAGPRFVDIGDGTVTDKRTGLMWERKTDDDSVHGVDRTYRWCQRPASEPGWLNCNDSSGPKDGSLWTYFFAKLNDDPTHDPAACFAGSCDWRLPAPQELATIWDKTQGTCGDGRGAACIYPALGPTRVDRYWSGDTIGDTSQHAWVVDFSVGTFYPNLKGENRPVRAVRGGP